MAIKSLEDMQSALKDNARAAEFIEFFNDLTSKVADHEREVGTLVGKVRRANSEAQTAKLIKKKLEELGYEGEDPDAIDDWIKSQIKHTDTKQDTTPNAEIEKLRREFKKAQDALVEKTQEASKVKQMSDRRVLLAKITEALTAGNSTAADLRAKDLIAEGKVKLADDEQIVFVDGENEVDFTTGIKKLLASRPDLIKNSQAPGARSSTRPQSAAPRYTMDQLKNMSANEIAGDMANVLESVKSQKT